MLAVVFTTLVLSLAADPAIIELWPGKPPGEVKELPPEADVNKPTDPPVGDRKIIKLTNVSTPTLAIYPTPEGKTNGAALIICPGGGHNILAYDHEGTECAEYFARLGVTCCVLKYRVPARSQEKRWIAAVQDAQRAVSVVRKNAKAWKLDPNRIGILGFSAGGETAGLAAILHAERQYEAPVDAFDLVSCRPDFAALIYPGGFTTKEKPDELRDYVKVDTTTPPMFLVHAYDDPVPPANSLLIAAECKKAGVSAELHLYASGGHGYGMRKTGHPVNSWPERCAEWMESKGWMKK